MDPGFNKDNLTVGLAVYLKHYGALTCHTSPVIAKPFSKLAEDLTGEEPGFYSKWTIQTPMQLNR